MKIMIEFVFVTIHSFILVYRDPVAHWFGLDLEEFVAIRVYSHFYDAWHLSKMLFIHIKSANLL